MTDGGPDDLTDRARQFVDDLEQQWSRFLPDSEISALNRRPGQVTLVSESTYELISQAEAGRNATMGTYNPLMLDQLEGHGYRQSWSESEVTPDNRPIERATTEPMVLFPELAAVCIPEGCRFDPGGIGKGMAADLTVDMCLEAGATTVSVELGGDLRVAGEPWYGPKWNIGVANPFDRGAKIGTFTPTEGAVATSTTLIKQWDHGPNHYHHLLDPQTGHPSSSDLVAVTTCSSRAWWAEIVAKASLIKGSEHVIAFLDRLKTPGIAVTASGEILSTGHDRPPALAGGGTLS
ncbi:MAG: FAD:protein FMN transferase [Actinomycetia bacterium]|nr:FAD:protein FMN transferase [Actinomycetes bacterium]